MSAAASHPFWFGTKRDPVFGWIHAPISGEARAAVVLCPPIGRSLSASYQSYRRISSRLAEKGFLVLRFDYRTTGNSSGDLDQSDCVLSWIESIGTAAGFVRSLGCQRVALVGMRLGANLAARAVDAGLETEGLLLWDPFAKGRGFLRDEKTLYKLYLGVSPSSDGIEIPGHRYRSDVADELERYDLVGRTEWASTPTHLLFRSDRQIPKLADQARRGGATVETAPDGIDLMDVLDDYPGGTLPGEEQVVGWLDSHFDLRKAPFRQGGADSAELTVRGSAATVVERAARLGPDSLFSIETVPSDPLSEMTVVFLNSAAEHHIGPARQWVELSRRLAAAGTRCVRVDLSGLGESPAHPGRPEHLVYAPEAIGDVHAIAQAVGGGDPSSVVIVGLCSGAYTAIEAASTLQVGGVCAVNPVLDFHQLPAISQDSLQRQAVTPKRRWLSELVGSPLGARIVRRVPGPIWHLLDLFWVQRSPARGLVTLVDHSIPSLVVCGDLEGRPALDRRGHWLIRRMRRSGIFRFEVIPGLDHAAVIAEGRAKLADLLVGYLLRDLPAVISDKRNKRSEISPNDSQLGELRHISDGSVRVDRMHQSGMSQ